MKDRLLSARALLLVLIFILLPMPVPSATLEIDREKSVFAVVTGKAGLAAGLAHQHLVVAVGYAASIQHDGTAPETTAFEIDVSTASFNVDDPELGTTLFPRLVELAVIEEPFAELDEKKRGKIRKSMLSRSQLDSENHPTIRASISSIEPADRQDGSTAPDSEYLVNLSLTIKDRTVIGPVAATYDWSDSRLVAEATGTFLFTDFGIRPYSAALGTIKVRNEFQVYVYLEATALP